MAKGEAALKGVPGVKEATINLATSTATVTFAGERESLSTGCLPVVTAWGVLQRVWSDSCIYNLDKLFQPTRDLSV